jgi:type IV pilus assembly protein PilO
MSTATVTRPVSSSRNGNGSPRNWASPLNLHWAAVGLLVLLNIYLLVHIFVLWHLSSNFSAAAMDQQRTELRIATVAAQPLRGLDDKLNTATKGADQFYKERLPQSYSEVASELGTLTRKAGVRLTGAQYTPAIVLPNSPGQLTELDIDSRLSGDYRPLMMFLNSLERDKIFFVIRAVTFNGQQSGTVNLRLQLTTYLRGGPPPVSGNAAVIVESGAAAPTAAVPNPATPNAAAPKPVTPGGRR